MADRPPNQFDVFLSYHWRDHAQVETLAKRLHEQQLTVFLDRWYLAPGQSWPKALESTLSQCRSVAICVGQGEMGPWQQREQYLALERQVAAERQGQQFPVIPVLLPGAEPPLGFLSQNTWVDLRARGDDPVLLATLVGAIHGHPPGPDAQKTVRSTLATICPYRGLLYFREEDAPFFFGREAAIAQLVSAVQQHHLVAVVGASGSGKSSVVRAGLVPELRKSHDPVWEIATIVPTDRPVHALAAILMPFLEPDMSEVTRLRETNQLAEDLLSRKTALRDIVDRVLVKQPGTDRVLLIADQWEELFTLCKDDAVRRCFIDNILEATATTKLSTVLTLRGDFFGRAITDYRPLSDRVQGAQVNLGPMKRDELCLAIEEPAKKVGLTFEAGLVHLMLEQASDEPGHLPLLEFVLRQLWEQRRGGELHHEAYRAMGQLEGAIAAKADSIFGRLSTEDQRRVQQIFLRLVRPGEGEADTRRRATSTELGVGAQGLVKTLADERLVVTSRLAGSVEDTVEVSHEALVRHWAHLKGWVDADRQFLVWQQRLNAMRKEWEVGQRSPDLLLRGLPLREALDRLTKRDESFSHDERQFITASMIRRMRGRLTLAAIAGCVLMAIGLTVWLWGYSGEQALLKMQSKFVSIHVPPVMQAIAAGSFKQGDTQGRGDRFEKSQHQVTMKSFAMGKFEVTFEEYDRFALVTSRLIPGDQGWGRDKRPVINVSWDEAKAYAEWLSEETGKRYRLPTESEWEYAARSEGKDDLWAGTSNEEALKDYAVYAVNSENRTALVGPDQGRKPNASGLYDMSGNVWEWVEDCWHDSYKEAPTDGSAWLEENVGTCGHRVLRGGSWGDGPGGLRVSYRFWTSSVYRSPTLGFRLVQDLEP
ncbi:MAG TPA: SUMF1/EgtB/PvdO family nonheme iron enzyme [Nitrospira sp.]|nr:SUMF1/EgtB/PvdO family nonheme iron enzyme [Nitrospira sp.]